MSLWSSLTICKYPSLQTCSEAPNICGGVTVSSHKTHKGEELHTCSYQNTRRTLAVWKVKKLTKLVWPFPILYLYHVALSHHLHPYVWAQLIYILHWTLKCFLWINQFNLASGRVCLYSTCTLFMSLYAVRLFILLRPCHAGFLVSYIGRV